MMQAASDIYLGWTKGLDVRRHYYWRKLRDTGCGSRRARSPGGSGTQPAK